MGNSNKYRIKAGSSADEAYANIVAPLFVKIDKKLQNDFHNFTNYVMCDSYISKQLLCKAVSEFMVKYKLGYQIKFNSTDKDGAWDVFVTAVYSPHPRY